MSIFAAVIEWLNHGALIFETAILIICPCFKFEEPKDPEDVVCFEVVDMKYFI